MTMLRIPGQVFIGTSITSVTGTGGTEIANLEAAEVSLQTVTIGRTRRNIDRHRKPSVIQVADADLDLVIRNNDQQGMDIVHHFYSFTGGVKGNANSILARTPTVFSLLVIPRESGSVKYLYVSRCQVAADGDPQEMAWSRRKVWCPDGRIRLEVLAPITAGEPPWMVDDSTALAAAYTEL